MVAVLTQKTAIAWLVPLICWELSFVRQRQGLQWTHFLFHFLLGRHRNRTLLPLVYLDQSVRYMHPWWIIRQALDLCIPIWYESFPGLDLDLNRSYRNPTEWCKQVGICQWYSRSKASTVESNVDEAMWHESSTLGDAVALPYLFWWKNVDAASITLLRCVEEAVNRVLALSDPGHSPRDFQLVMPIYVSTVLFSQRCWLFSKLRIPR